MDGPDDGGLSQGEKVVVPLEIARPGRKAVSPVILLTETVALDHGPHGAIQHQDAPSEQRLQLGQPGLSGATVRVGWTGGNGGHWTSQKSKTLRPKRLKGSVLAIV
jgi:hypothetical protein